MFDVSYKCDSETLTSNSQEKSNLEMSLAEIQFQNLELIIKQLVDYLSQSDDLNVIKILQLLSSKSENEFTLEIVQHFQLLELMRSISKHTDTAVQAHIAMALIPLLNDKTIEYSINFGIIGFLVGLIQTRDQSSAFSAIQCLSKIAQHDIESHRQVVFQLSSLFDFDVFEQDKTKQNDEIELSFIKNSFGYQYPQYSLQPGIDPDHYQPILDQRDLNQLLKSYQQLDNYFTYIENGQKCICQPSLTLLTSLLKYPLPHSFVTYCLHQFVNILPISTEEILGIVLDGLCTLIDNQSNWHDDFQASNPGIWLGTLFEHNTSIKLNQQLMLFLLKIIKKGEKINGMPFSLLLQKLQLNNAILVKYAASIIDNMILLDKTVISPLVGAGLFPITKEVYFNTNFAAKNQIVSYLARIAQLGNYEHKVQMLQEQLFLGFISTLALDTEEHQLTVRLFTALIELFDVAKRESKLDYCLSLIDPDDIAAIRDIYQEHENLCLANNANAFIHTFFDENNEYDDSDDTPLFKF